MKILIVTPAPPQSRKGNRVTAIRWSRLLRELGHRVDIAQEFDAQRADLLVALHAGRSAASVARFAQLRPESPLVLALTGTDLYRDIHRQRRAQQSLATADRLIVLQSAGVDTLPAALRDKTRVIYQSVSRARRLPPLATRFEVCVLGHLRAVKDPFRAAYAARTLPQSSRLRVVQMGAALDESMRQKAEAEERRNHRYRWLGELPRWKARRRLARARLLVLSSKMEGGANVVSEALAADVPVLSSRISGSIGMLGTAYPGYFEVGDTRGLGALFERSENDPDFYQSLERACRDRQDLIAPQRERAAWRSLLAELAP